MDLLFILRLLRTCIQRRIKTKDLLIKRYKFLIFENRAIVTVVQYTYLNKISTIIIIIIYYYVPCQIALVLYINLFNYQYPQEQKYQVQVQSQIHKFL